MFDERDLRGIAEYKTHTRTHTHTAHIHIYGQFARRGNGLLEPAESDSVGVRERNTDFIITTFFFLLQRIKQTGREIRPYRGPQYIDEH